LTFTKYIILIMENYNNKYNYIYNYYTININNIIINYNKDYYILLHYYYYKI